MKKNLLYLLALVCSLTLFAACSSDDDDSDNKNNENPPEEEAVITAPDVIGTYWGNLDISRFPQYVPITSGAVITASSSGGFSLFLLSLSSSSLLQAAKRVREHTNANKYNRFFFIRLWFSYYNKFVLYKLKRRKKVQYASFFEVISSSQLSYRKLCYICI